MTATGLADRSDAMAGSFFDPLPPGAGGYLLCAVLHDWDDAPARAILRRCAQAAGTDGRVFVVEKLVTDTDHRTEMDLRVLAYFGGRATLPNSLRSPQLRGSGSPRCIPRGPHRSSN